MRELEQLYKEEQASAIKYKELAEERVKKLEATVEKYKKMIPPSPRSPILNRHPSKLLRSPSKIVRTTTKSSLSGLSKRREPRKSLKSVRIMEEIKLDDLEVPEDAEDTQAGDLPNMAEEQEGVDFPWLEFVRANSHQLPTPGNNRHSQDGKSSDPTSQRAFETSTHASITSSPSLSHSSASDACDEENEEFEKSETPDPESKPANRNRKSKQRAHKLQQQIQQKLQQKAKIENSHQKEGDVG